MAWSVEFLNEDVASELKVLPREMRSSFERIVRLVRTFGIERVQEPYIKHIEDRVWEMRLKGKDGIARALYVTAFHQRVVVVRVFVKKTERTPRREIELAKQRAKEVR